MKIKPRKYQQDFFDLLITALEQHNRICAVLPTGGGKTIVMAMLNEYFDSKKKSIFTLVHRQELLAQAVAKYASFGLQPGAVTPGEMITKNRCQVAMVQTLSKRIKHLSTFPPAGIITDECHHARASTYESIYDSWGSSKSIGFTATPERLDGKGLIDVYSHMIKTLDTIDLVNMGYLSDVIVLSTPAALEMRKIKKKIKGSDFDQQQQEEFVRDVFVVGECIDLYAKFFNGAPCIVFGASIADCDMITAEMKKAGWKWETVKGDMDADFRRYCFAALGDGRLNGVSSFNLISEGVDIPVTAGGIIRRLTASVSMYLQFIGRVLRISPGKGKAIVIDQVGCCFLHGHPFERREWSLYGEKRKPKDIKEGLSLICELCGALMIQGANKCPYCDGKTTNDSTGIKINVSIIAGQLKEMHRPDVGDNAVAAANIMQLEEIDRENATIEMSDGIKNRFDILMKMLNKEKYIDVIWQKYSKGGRLE